MLTVGASVRNAAIAVGGARRAAGQSRTESCHWRLDRPTCPRSGSDRGVVDSVVRMSSRDLDDRSGRCRSRLQKNKGLTSSVRKYQTVRRPPGAQIRADDSGRRLRTTGHPTSRKSWCLRGSNSRAWVCGFDVGVDKLAFRSSRHQLFENRVRHVVVLIDAILELDFKGAGRWLISDRNNIR